ncbi:MAG: glycosyltransferase [Phyllobacteriaceae bacterium]|nr:glycosyltransferase [Phyllobacteriaceae bacterium]
MSASPPPVVVPRLDRGIAVEDCGDRLVEIAIEDPDGRLGRCPRVVIRRRDPRRPSPARAVLLDRHGRGRFLGWLPEDPVGVEIVADPAAAGHPGRSPTARLAVVPIWRMVATVVVRRPIGVLRVLRLRLAGNRKGAIARFVRLFDAIAAPSYAVWSVLRDEEDALARPGLLAELAAWPRRPVVEVRIGAGPATARAASRDALEAQIYPHVRIVEADAPLGGDVVAEVPAGVRLSPDALWHLVRPFAFDPRAVAAYCDEDEIDRRGRRRSPIFRGAWSPALAEAGGLAPTVVAVRRDRMVGEDIGAAAGERLVEIAAGHRTAVHHVPRVCVHRPVETPPPRPLARPAPRLAEGERPKVGVVVPSRDRAELLAACVDGLFRRTTGIDLEVVIVDNGSREAATARLYERLAGEPRIRVIERPGPFNFPDLIAAGVAETRQELLLLLNNDVEPIEPGWLAAMVAELGESDVGAVGARLLFPDGHVQHGGVTLGAGGIARHTFHFFGLRGGEDRGLLATRRDVSAITAACLLTRRSHWDCVGGMDGRSFAVAYNDVDFCLRLRKAGLRVVWTPEATLIHRESVSRGAIDTPEKRSRFAAEEAELSARWGAELSNDPFHNPNLSLVGEGFTLELVPRDRQARVPS